MMLIEVKRNYMGRVKYTLELDNGTTHEFGGETIAEIIYKGKEIEVDYEAYLDMRQLKAGYYELSEDVDGYDKVVFDVYKHHFVEGYNGLEIGECELIGSWRREKTAMNHYNKLISGR